MKIQTAIMIENIALMIFCAYMVTMTGNGWWVLCLLFGTSYTKTIREDK